MTEESAISPTQIILHKKSRTLEVVFNNGVRFNLPCEYWRVFSPSADARGSDVGKSQVNILAIEPVGNYAVKLVFSDGHRTGLYHWQLLYELGQNYQHNWKTYLEKSACNKKT